MTLINEDENKNARTELFALRYRYDSNAYLESLRDDQAGNEYRLNSYDRLLVVI